MAFPDLVTLADRAVQANLGGVPVLVQPSTGPAITEPVVGIFEREFVMTSPHDQDAQDTGPAVWLKLADLPVHPDDDADITFTIAGETYRKRHSQPDDPVTGGSILVLLHLAPP